MLKLTYKNADSALIAATLKCYFSSSSVVFKPISEKPNETQKTVILAEFLKDPKADQKAGAREKFDHTTNQPLKFYDPPYLARKAPFPNYELLNINIKGYDHTALDANYKLIERICSALKVRVVEAYPMPQRSFKVKTYQPFSVNLDKEYNIQMFHRVVRVGNVSSTVAPTLLEAIQMNLPEGVTLSVSVPTPEEDEFRYVPDIELNDLRVQLASLTDKSKYEKEIEAAQQATAKAAAKAALQAKAAAPAPAAKK
jgi:ribosomal protein S10